jgi:thiaminase/transcriptional activator TenA
VSIGDFLTRGRRDSMADWPEWMRDKPAGAARFSDWLRERAEPDWTAATTHRFTREVIGGSVESAVMVRYLVQDYAFIDGFVALLGAAIHAAPGLPRRLPLARFLGMIASDENTFFSRSFDALGVAEALRDRPPLSAPARGFQALMTEAAASGRYAEALAVLVVAEWVYLSWALPARETRTGPFWCTEWVDLHANPDFERFVGWLRGELDREGAALDAAGRARVLDLFRRAAALERAFFDAAYEA